MKSRIHGVREIRRAIRRAPVVLQDEAMKEVRASTQAMHRAAMANFNTASKYAPLYHGKMGMQSLTGIARRSYRYSVSKKRLSGRVGLLSSTAASRAFYLYFFMYGTVNQPARPVHDDAFDGEKDHYIDAQTKALRRVLTTIFGPA